MSRKRNMSPKDFKSFQISKPFGYYPPDVDETIKKYEKALNQSISKIKELESKNSETNKKLNHVQKELRSLHLELSSLELPTVDDAVTSLVLNDFKTSNRTKEEIDEEWKSNRPQKPFSKGETIEIATNTDTDYNNDNENNGTTFIIAK